MRFIIRRRTKEKGARALHKAGFCNCSKTTGHLVLTLKQQGRTKGYDYREEIEHLYNDLYDSINRSKTFEAIVTREKQEDKRRIKIKTDEVERR